MKVILLTMLFAICISFAGAEKTVSNNIGKIVKTYLEIKDALAADDGTTVKFKANDLYNLLATNPDKGLRPSQSRLLADQLSFLLRNTKAMTETIIEKEQRVYFGALSRSLYTLLKGIKANNITIYQEYCPANDLYWLSETVKIKNPYYNDSDKEMSACGTVIATLHRIK